MDLPENAVTVLSLCSGGAGFDLGFRLAVTNAVTICWVEWESFAAAELVRRMEEGELDEAPVFTDLKKFDGKPWRGVVDCVIAGFPCQPSSVSGKRLGSADKRNLWPDVSRVIEEVRPSVVFLENVPGLLTVEDGNLFRGILADLERLDFSIAFDLFTASEVGASHKRERLFILGVEKSGGSGTRRESGSTRREYRPSVLRQENRSTGADRIDAADGTLVNGQCPRRKTAGQRFEQQSRPESEARGRTLADSTSGGFGERSSHLRRVWSNDVPRHGDAVPALRRDSFGDGHLPIFPPGPGAIDEWRDILREFPELAPAV